MRTSFINIDKYIATTETSKHRWFTYLPIDFLPDQKIRVIATSDDFVLSVLSSRIHVAWATAIGGRVGKGNDPVYNNTVCFDPFPFPDPSPSLKAKLRAAGEELDAFRKTRQAEHPNLTLTQMYNVLEKLRAMDAAKKVAAQPSASSPGLSRGPTPLEGSEGEDVGGRVKPGHEGGGGSKPRHDVGSGSKPGHDGGVFSKGGATPTASPQGGDPVAAVPTLALTPDEERIKEQGLILVLMELHDTIDRLTAEAYGWPVDLSDDAILERLVALNAERAKEEAAGHVRWLRPDYQIPRFAKGAAAKTGEMDLGENVVSIEKALPAFPTDRYEQPLAAESMLLSAGRSMEAAELARGFKRGGKRIEQRIAQVLTTLARYGRITALPDGRYAGRLAA